MNFGEYFQFFWALLFVIGLIIILALAARRLGFGLPVTILKRESAKRISILEASSIDARRKLVLVKCDEKEYLLLLGANSERVIDANIKPEASNPNADSQEFLLGSRRTKNEK